MIHSYVNKRKNYDTQLSLQLHSYKTRTNHYKQEQLWLYVATLANTTMLNYLLSMLYVSALFTCHLLHHKCYKMALLQMINGASFDL